MLSHTPRRKCRVVDRGTSRQPRKRLESVTLLGSLLLSCSSVLALRFLAVWLPPTSSTSTLSSALALISLQRALSQITRQTTELSQQPGSADLAATTPGTARLSSVLALISL